MAAAYGRSLGSGTQDGGPTSIVITVGANASVGEKLVMAMGFFQNATPTVTDSGSNTWTVNHYRQSGDQSSLALAWADCTTALTSGVSTITAEWGELITGLATAHALTGTESGAPTASGATEDFLVTSWHTADTTTTDGSVLFGGCSVRYGAALTNTAVRGTERYDNGISVMHLFAQSNEYAVGSASSDIAGSLSDAPDFIFNMAHYGWGPLPTPPAPSVIAWIRG